MRFSTTSRELHVFFQHVLLIHVPHVLMLTFLLPLSPIKDKLVDPTSVSYLFRLTPTVGCVMNGLIGASESHYLALHFSF